jgi:hypothetical protein
LPWSGCPDPAVLLSLHSFGCPDLAVLPWCFVLPVLFWLSVLLVHLVHGCYPVMAVLIWLSCSGFPGFFMECFVRFNIRKYGRHRNREAWN